MLLLATIFVAGILHGLGPDHLAAITAFGAVVGRDFRRIAVFSAGLITLGERLYS